MGYFFEDVLHHPDKKSKYDDERHAQASTDSNMEDWNGSQMLG